MAKVLAIFECILVVTTCNICNNYDFVFEIYLKGESP